MAAPFPPITHDAASLDSILVIGLGVFGRTYKYILSIPSPMIVPANLSHSIDDIVPPKLLDLRA